MAIITNINLRSLINMQLAPSLTFSLYYYNISEYYRLWVRIRIHLQLPRYLMSEVPDGGIVILTITTMENKWVVRLRNKKSYRPSYIYSGMRNTNHGLSQCYSAGPPNDTGSRKIFFFALCAVLRSEMFSRGGVWGWRRFGSCRSIETW